MSEIISENVKLHGNASEFSQADDAFSWNKNNRFTPADCLGADISVLQLVLVRTRTQVSHCSVPRSIKNHTSHSDVPIDSARRHSTDMNRYFLNSS